MSIQLKKEFPADEYFIFTLSHMIMYTIVPAKFFWWYFPRDLKAKDNGQYNKMIVHPNVDTQNCPFCRLQIVVKTFEHFYQILIGWFIWLSFQTFQPLNRIYIRVNFVYHHWLCKSIYRPLSYPFRSPHLMFVLLWKNDKCGYKGSQ